LPFLNLPKRASVLWDDLVALSRVSKQLNEKLSRGMQLRVRKYRRG
jgi:hypothetical protein